MKYTNNYFQDIEIRKLLIYLQVPSCDSVGLNPALGAKMDQGDDHILVPFPSVIPVPLYVNTSPIDNDCSCQVHYATYRPRQKGSHHVAGIHKASTMPRKVVFGEEMTNIYQQTQL